MLPSMRPILNAFRVLTFVVLVASATRMAWVGDDALITLRTALNVTHGWGPGFNATESVMAYTHPLWFLIWTAIGSLSATWIGAVFAMSLGLSAVAIGLVVWSAKTPTLVIAAGGSLLLSSAFMDYTSSGLETPLAYVLVALVILQLVRRSYTSTLGALVLGVTVAGLILTRMDLVILVTPVLLLSAWQLRRSLKGLGALIAGVIAPLSMWLLWSQHEYGSWLPNTFAAKTNLSIPRQDLVVQGLHYFQVTAAHDLATFLVLLGWSALVLIRGGAMHRLVLGGVGIYLLYVAWVGGDFMVGRFLAVPTFVAVLIGCLAIQTIRWESSHRVVAPTLTAVGFFALAVISALLSSMPTSLLRDPGQKWTGTRGIVDERGVYAELGRSLHYWALDAKSVGVGFKFSAAQDANPWESLRFYDQAASAWPTNLGEPLAKPTQVGTVCWLGGTALMTGPMVHWIDICALADRYLAEIPSGGTGWRIGHFKRTLPKGYVEAVTNNDPRFIPDPNERERLTALWREIRVGR